MRRRAGTGPREPYGQQLAIGGLDNRLRRTLPSQKPLFKDARRTRHAELARTPASDLPPLRARPLLLFDLPRDLAAGARRGFPEPPDANFAAAVDAFALDYGRRHGWPQEHNRLAPGNRVRRALRVLVSIQDIAGAPIKASEAARLRDIDLPVAPVIDILADVGLLDDDRVPILVSWFERQITGLPGLMTEELRTWLTIARLGYRTPPRSKPRPERTIRIWTEPVVPVLRHWAATHASLREISRKDVKDALDPLQGSRAVRTLQGLRALFRTLKRHKVLFTDPTSGIHMAIPAPSVPLPLDLEPLVAAINSADPAQAALAALFAFHGLSPAQARSLPLTAFSNGRLHLADGRVILLAQEARERLQAYVDERARRWPGTTNPHLFITQFTARRTTPVSSWWMNNKLGLPAQAIREDRILDEAQAAGDPRRLCDLFGLSVGGTLRYTAALNHPDLDEIRTRTTRPKP